jgi:SAM-dependent methyltransferase
MTSDPLSDVVSAQYETWVYPEPIVDLPAWMESSWQWFDPRISHRMMWPDRPYSPDLDILIAGCGTNQAAVFAYSNPSAKVVAIDVSQTSLDHHRFLKEKYQLTNLELHRLPIEDVESLGLTFDLIVSSGVLHHMADPLLGMQSLAGVLRPDGVIAIMLYAKYGRLGVEMMQGIFRDMGLRQDQESIDKVREALAALPPGHPVQSYLEIAPDLQFDAGLVDTFLHGRDRNYTVDDCLELVENSGLVFQEWLLKSPYYPHFALESGFLADVAALPERAQWAAMERINFRNGCHFFTACHPARPTSTYVIDFASDEFSNFVPEFRHACSLNGPRLSRYDWSMDLDGDQLAFVELVDGQRTIEEIMTLVEKSGSLAKTDQISEAARATFRSLWQLDFLSMGIRN